jgi:hypothetical protein
MAFVPVRIKAVTTNLIKLSKGATVYFRANSDIYKGKPIEQGPVKEPPNLLDVTMLDTGEIGCIILPTVAHKELMQAYPAGVKGKCFELTLIAPGDGKRYNLARIAEIMDPEPSPPAPVLEVPGVVVKPATAKSK